jgi:hypothetical protein
MIEKAYTILDQEGEASGLLQLAICEDYASLDKIMAFSKLEETANFTNHPFPSSCGFQYFEKQLPIREIYPVAVLKDIEIKYKKQKKGVGRKAIQDFKVIGEKYGSRLGLLRIGTTMGDQDYESGVCWRRRFYESESWKCFETPPIKGLVLIWMYQLLSPLQSTKNQNSRRCLVDYVEKKPESHIAVPIP